MQKPFDGNDLSRQATQYELACQAAGIGVWELHVREDRLAYSEVARSIFGFPLDGPVTRQMVHGSIHPEDLESVLKAAQRAMDPVIRSNEHYVYRIRRFDTGELRWLRGRGIAHFETEDEVARPMLYAGSVQDITEREVTQRALAASEERLRLALDAARMAVWDLDLDAGVVAPSPDLNRMLGFPEDAHPSVEELRSRYAPGEQERMEAEGAAARAKGETSLQTRVRYVLPHKGEVTYVLRAAQAQAPSVDGRSNRVVGVLFDATEQVRAEERLSTLNAELRHRLKNMAQLAGIFARQTWPGDARLDGFLGRIRALSMSADFLFGSRGSQLRLQDVVERSLRPFRTEPDNPFRIAGPDVELSDGAFTGIALALHELATNAFKHGALSVPGGTVALTWVVESNVVRMEWREMEGPRVHEPEHQGFGLKLICQAALPPPHVVQLDFRPEGLVATISARIDVERGAT
jgi:PAS domain S-box-containing protein